MEDNSDLTAFIYAAMADYTAGNTADGDAKMVCAKPFFDKAMETCTETNPLFIKAELFFADFEQSANADATR